MYNGIMDERVARRLFSRTVEMDGCLVYTGSRARHPRHPEIKTYGTIQIGKSLKLAHRVAWELAHGPIPNGMKVLHHCDNPPCVKTEPDEQYPEGHLWLGTQTDNMRDMGLKGRRNDGMPRPGRQGIRGPHAKLTDDKVREIRRLSLEGMSLNKLGAKFGVNASTIFHIVHRHKWKHVI